MDGGWRCCCACRADRLCPLIKLNSNITKLTVAVDNFQRALDKLEGENRESHKIFYERLDGHDKELAQHEQRLKALEEE